MYIVLQVVYYHNLLFNKLIFLSNLYWFVMSNRKDSNRILEFRESRERPPKRRTLSTYFGDGNSGNLQDSQSTSPLHIEEGDSSQVGEYFEEVQVGEPDI